MEATKEQMIHSSLASSAASCQLQVASCTLQVGSWQGTCRRVVKAAINHFGQVAAMQECLFFS